MIRLTDDLHGSERTFADQLQRFLAAEGIDPHRYWIGPSQQEPLPGAEIVARFGSARTERQDTRTELSLPFAGPLPPLVTGFSDATNYMMFVLTQSEQMAELRSIDSELDEEALLDALRIDWQKVCRPSVEAWAEGSFLAPDNGGYVYFLVEPYGEVAILARCTALAPVAWAYAADKRMQATKFINRVVKIAPIRR